MDLSNAALAIVQEAIANQDAQLIARKLPTYDDLDSLVYLAHMAGFDPAPLKAWEIIERVIAWADGEIYKAKLLAEAIRPRKKPIATDKRGAFAYKMLCDLHQTEEEGLRRFRTEAVKRKWKDCTTVNGLRDIAKRHQKNSGLDPIPPRRARD